MLTAIKEKFTAAWKAHFAALGAGVTTYLLAKAGFIGEPDPAVLEATRNAAGEIVFSLVAGVGAWLTTYFSPANK
jgi:hypothetical protein